MNRRYTPKSSYNKVYKTYSKEDCSKTPCDKTCNCDFTRLLTDSLGRSIEIERNINTLYQNDPILVTKPLDEELLRLTQRLLVQISIELRDMIRLFNPCDFICDSDLVFRRLSDAAIEVPVIETLLANINALKSSSDRDDLCTAEQNFVIALTSADLLLGNLFQIRTVYKCIDCPCL